MPFCSILQNTYLIVITYKDGCHFILYTLPVNLFKLTGPNLTIHILILCSSYIVAENIIGAPQERNTFRCSVAKRFLFNIATATFLYCPNIVITSNFGRAKVVVHNLIAAFIKSVFYINTSFLYCSLV